MSAPPLKAERLQCWNARDDYWKCLDENNGESSMCEKLRKPFEGYCSKQWVRLKGRNLVLDSMIMYGLLFSGICCDCIRSFYLN
jgi:hypothetical protein